MLAFPFLFCQSFILTLVLRKKALATFLPNMSIASFKMYQAATALQTTRNNHTNINKFMKNYC